MGQTKLAKSALTIMENVSSQTSMRNIFCLRGLDTKGFVEQIDYFLVNPFGCHGENSNSPKF